MFIKFFVVLLILFTKPLVSFSYDGFKANQQLITKLANVKETLAKKDPSWSGVGLRLADLFSEQSRLCISHNCKPAQILNFRSKAINLYKEVLPTLDKHSRLNVYSQLGHLLQLSNKNTLAIKFYQKALQLKTNTNALLVIKMSLAQAYFRLGNYKKAIVFYDQVLQEPNFKKYNLAVHKKSWALFRLNKIRKATSTLEGLVKKSYKDKSLNLIQVDSYFYSELLKDLVLFYSYESKNPLNKAKKLLVWAPKKNQIKYLVFFAQELERLGHLASSIKLWNFNLDYLNSNKDRILAYQHITQAYYKSLLFAKASKSFSSLVTECKKNLTVCQTHEVALKNLLVDWFSMKKNRTLLLQNCSLFAQLFPNNGDILVLSAQLGVALKQWNVALNFYKKMDLGLKAKTLIFKDKKLLALSREHFLWTQIEVAELSKNAELLNTTYEYFINNATDKNKIFKIQYQRFVSLHAKKQYESLLKDFTPVFTKYIENVNLNKVAKSNNLKPVVIRSANLILQTLVKLNKDQQIEMWVQKYQAYPFSKTESWKAYKNQAILNQVAALSKTGTNTLAYSKLLSLPITNLKGKAKIDYYYNQLSLLEKLKQRDKEEVVISKLLGLKKQLTVSQYNPLVLRKIWLSELKLDFKTAFTYLQKLVNKNTSSDRYLRLILFAELSGKVLPFNSKYYTQFFKKEKDLNKKQALAVSLLKRSNFNLKIFTKYEKYLLKKQYHVTRVNVLNQLSFNSRKLHKGFLYRTIRSKRYNKKIDSQFLSRFYHLDKQYKPWLKNITQHKIKTKTQYQISKGLKRRLYWIGKGEKLLNLAVKEKDSVLQMFYSFALLNTSARLHKEILQLPLPKGLTPEESQLYSKVLEEKANVYKSKQEYYTKYYTQFWENSELLSSLEKQSKLNSENSFLLNLFLSELKAVAPENISIRIASLENKLKENVSNRNISSASKTSTLSLIPSKLKQQVKQFPENTDYLKALMKEEEKLNNKSMLAYLNSRLILLNNKTNKIKE